MNNNNISCVSLVVSLSFQRQSHFRHILWKQHKAVWEAHVFAESSWKLTCNSGGLTAAPTRAINPKFNTKTGSHTETVESPWRKCWQILVWIVKTVIIYGSSSSQSNSFDVIHGEWLKYRLNQVQWGQCVCSGGRYRWLAQVISLLQFIITVLYSLFSVMKYSQQAALTSLKSRVVKFGFNEALKWAPTTHAYPLSSISGASGGICKPFW